MEGAQQVAAGKRLSRKKQIQELCRLGKSWTTFSNFFQHYQEINAEYRQRTRNFSQPRSACAKGQRAK
jgi:2-keto-4-pentenoate hydratase/2-oxohepta-3-ene-1,7-dioic acid hydratase in catechol pathway